MIGRKHLLFVLCVLMIPLCLTVPGTYAEVTEGEYQTYDLGDVVISAETTKDKDIAITNEITAEDIKTTNSHTVAEALSHAPGIRVTTGAKNLATASIHGFDQSKILVMIDGVPYYETKFGILDLNSLSTENIAKIEIIKGAPSIIYGANTMGGVINIISKKATEKPYTSASVEVSENDTYRWSATNGRKVGIFSYWLNYVNEKSGGWNLSDDYNAKSGKLTDKRTSPSTVTYPVFEDGGERDNSGYEGQNLWAKFGIEPNKDSEYYANFHYLQKEKGVPSNTVSNNVYSRPVFSQFYADQIPNYNSWGLDLDGRQKILDNLAVKAKLFFHKHEDSLYSYESPSFYTILAKSHYSDYVAGASLITEYQPASWDTIRLALHYTADSHKEVADEYLPEEKYYSYTGSVGLENEFNWVKNLSIILGASYDWFDVTEAKKNTTDSNGDFVSQDDIYTPDDHMFNPMIGATYTFTDNTKIFASLGQKSRFPTLNSLYNVIANGDPRLKSEKSVNMLAGVSHAFGTFVKADLSLFRYDVDDKISSVGSGSDKRLVNIGEVLMQGVEIGIDLYPIDRLVIHADYTYNHAEDKSSNKVSDDVTDVPEHVANLSIQYTLPVTYTKIDLNGSYMGSVYTNVTPGSENKLDDYFLCGIKISQPFLKYFEAYVAANNLLDEDYEWGDGYPGQGRNFWAGLSVKF